VELRQLEAFAAVARHGQFTRAAEDLWITQSALSQQMRKLEAELGVALLRRGSRGVTVTAAGEDLLAHARVVLAEVAAAREDVDRHAGLRRGRVRVAATTADATRLPGALAAFHRAHPAIQIALRHAAGPEVVALVGRGSVDVGVAGLAGDPPPGVAATLLAPEPLLALLAPGDPLTASAPLDAGALRDRPFVLAEPGTALRETVAAACRAAGFSPIPLFEVSDPQTARRLAHDGLAVALVPGSWLEQPGAAVAGVALAEPAPRHRVALLTGGAAPPPGAAGLLLEALERDLAGAGSEGAGEL